jgi:hypothetical protein
LVSRSASVHVSGEWAGMKSVATLSDGTRWLAMDDRGEPWRPSGEFRVALSRRGAMTAVVVAEDSARAYNLRLIEP